VEISSGKPYYEVEMPYYTLRRFPKELDEEFLVWHRDRQSRNVKVVSGNGWMLQLDNKLPVRLEEDIDYYIPEMVYHRLLKGDGDLVLEIIKE
jgi:hypothetical protein